MEWLLSIVLSNPSATRWVARAVVTACCVLAVMGLRVDRLAGRLDRVGAALPPLDQILPMWIAAFVPESGPGWLALVLVAAMAAVLGTVIRLFERTYL